VFFIGKKLRYPKEASEFALLLKMVQIVDNICITLSTDDTIFDDTRHAPTNSSSDPALESLRWHDDSKVHKFLDPSVRFGM